MSPHLSLLKYFVFCKALWKYQYLHLKFILKSYLTRLRQLINHSVLFLIKWNRWTVKRIKAVVTFTLNWIFFNVECIQLCRKKWYWFESIIRYLILNSCFVHFYEIYVSKSQFYFRKFIPEVILKIAFSNLFKFK